MKPVYALVITENHGKETSHEGWLNAVEVSGEPVYTLQPSQVYDPEAFHIHIQLDIVRSIFPAEQGGGLELSVGTTDYNQSGSWAKELMETQQREIEALKGRIQVLEYELASVPPAIPVEVSA